MLADNTRAEILTVLMDGRAHTGGELARSVGVSASTASEHLSKLLDSEMVAVAAQGRHRYFRLANREIAVMLEALGAAPVAGNAPAPRAPAALLYARTCYDHLAGELAVRIYDHLVASGHLNEHDDHVELTDSGSAHLEAVGVDVQAARAAKRPTVRACLDWTERRHHLAGAVASGLLDALLDKKWIARSTTPRAIRITEAGRVAMFDHFELGDARLSA
ncbi:UNVERIFIED_CONTAM: hypothetical protein GTU68_042951 [Idotea baltica]|nr:hypothetical protein [Idotea baltica]